MKISGKQLATKIHEQTEKKVQLLSEHKVTAQLVIVKSHESDAVNNYINQKIKRGTKLGITVNLVAPDAMTLESREKLNAFVKELNSRIDIHGLIFQKPSHINVNDELETLIDPSKDVDGFLPNTLHRAPIYRGVLLILREAFEQRGGKILINEDFFSLLKTKKFVIVGKGKTGGAPAINGLKKDGVPETNIHIIDSKTDEVTRKKFISSADVIISAVGKPSALDSTQFPKKSILIDMGVHFDEQNKIHGDYEENQLKDQVSFYTTTPGGVGALTVAYLMDNTVNAAIKQNNISYKFTDDL